MNRKGKERKTPLGGGGKNKELFMACKDFLLLVLFSHFVVLKYHFLQPMQTALHVVHVFARGAISFYMGSFRFRCALSTRAHGVPFLHTSGAHLTAPLCGAIAVWACRPLRPL